MSRTWRFVLAFLPSGRDGKNTQGLRSHVHTNTLAVVIVVVVHVGGCATHACVFQTKQECVRVLVHSVDVLVP